jgi:uroporphyrin-III C-methyltransferase/precorrin-2 dehydrogenase/sirohydrochlorin ferrochelatase
MPDLLPLFLNLTGRDVVLVGGGPVATAKLRQLLAAGAKVRIIAPEITPEMRDIVAGAASPRPLVAQRPFKPADLDGAWLVVAAATPDANRQVADIAESLRIFVNAVDDPANASAFLSGVVRRDGVTLAISTSGAAPALTALLREALDAVLPRDLAAWVWQARAARTVWRRDSVPMEARKPRLLQALNQLYPEKTAETAQRAERNILGISAIAAIERGPRVPWLNAPEDSWL